MSVLKWLGSCLLVALFAVAIVSIVALHDTGRRIDALEGASRLVETRHGALEYAVWGEGPRVLVVHGAGGGFDQGRLLADSLGGAGFTWIAVSRFGYLRSDLPADASAAAQANAFADLLDELSIERAGLLAMSGGVPPALKFAEIYPERTDRMVLLSSAPFTPFSPTVEGRPMPTWLYSTILGNDVLYWTLTKIARDALAAAFDARPELRQGVSAAEAAMIDQLIDGFLPASRRLAGVNNEGAAVDPSAVYRLEAIQAPTLVVHARDDRMTPFTVSEAIAEGVADAELLALDSGGHLLLGSHADLKRRIETFLGGPPAR